MPEETPLLGQDSHEVAEPKSKTSRRRLLAVFGAGAMLSAASLTQAAGNFVFHIVSTRMLGPAEYARLGALLNLVLLIGVPLAAIQLAATISVAKARTQSGDGEDLRGLNWRLWLLSGMAFAGVLVAAPLIDSFFKVDEIGSTLLIAPFVAASVVLAGWRGAAIGRGRDKRTAASYLISPVLRLGLGVPLLLNGGGVRAAMIATVAGEIAALLVISRAVRSQKQGAKARFDLGSAGASAVMLTGLWLFSGVDVFVSVRVLDASATGEYLALAGLARTAMMVPQIFASVGVRHWTSRIQHRSAGRPVEGGMSVRQLIRGWLGLATLGVAAFWVTADWWVGLLFGANQVTPEGPATAVLLVAGAAVCGVVVIASYYFKAQNSQTAYLPWIWAFVVLGVLVAVSLVGGVSETTLAGWRLGVVSSGAVVMLWLAGRHERLWQRTPRAPEGTAEDGPIRVLHVIGEYIYEEGMGRTIDRVSSMSGDAYRSDVVCAIAHSRGPGVGEIIELGGKSVTLMLRHRHLRKVSENYDLVHFHGGTVALLSAARMAAHMPVVATVYGVADLPSKRELRLVGWKSLRASNVLTPRVLIFNLIPTWVQTRAVRRVQMVFTHDQRWAEKMAEKLGTELGPQLVRPGVRGDLEFSAQWRAEAPEIIFVGRSEKVRGITQLLDAYQLVRQHRPDARLALHLLTTAEAEEIAEAAEGLPGVEVSFEPLSDTETRLAEAQVGVWPYLADYTTSPPALAPLEALSVGLPVVGTRVVCLKDILDGGSVGGEVESGDVGGLAQAILDLIGDQKRWTEASASGLAVSRAYSWESYTKTIQGGWAAALEGSTIDSDGEESEWGDLGAEVLA